jgi:hypothetical protein
LFEYQHFFLLREREKERKREREKERKREREKERKREREKERKTTFARLKR